MPSVNAVLDDPLIGQHIGRYRIDKELARGGMGVVYVAVHEEIGHLAAVKVLSSELSQDANYKEYRGRFFDEARAVNIVQHPGIVKIFDFGTLPNQTVYIMMEYLEGESLWKRFERMYRRIPLQDALRVTRQIASSLAAAHEKKIIHRDLKPENVILIHDPEAPGEERTKILDFGIAKFMDSSFRRTAAGMVMGTALYMAPEQCEGASKIDGKADVYSLGVMLYEMLAGRTPFDGQPSAIMMSHIDKPPPPIKSFAPAIPETVVQLVDEMLMKDPAERPSMEQVVQRIKGLAGSGRSLVSFPPASGPKVSASFPPMAAEEMPDAHAPTQMVSSILPTRKDRKPLVTRHLALGAIFGSAMSALLLGVLWLLTAARAHRPPPPPAVMTVTTTPAPPKTEPSPPPPAAELKTNMDTLPPASEIKKDEKPAPEPEEAPAPRGKAGKVKKHRGKRRR